MAEPMPVDRTDPVGPSTNDDGQPPAEGTGGFAFVCPACAEPFQLTQVPANGLVECPSCGAQFFAATDEEEIAAEARAEAEAEAARQDRDAELSELRVRQVSTLRRSMIRARGYFLTGAWTCVGSALQLTWAAGLKIHRVHAALHRGRRVGGWGFAVPVIEIVFAIASIVGCRYFFRRAAKAQRELRATAMKEPDSPPDLSTLGGGIERWRGLEKMHQQAGGDE